MGRPLYGNEFNCMKEAKKAYKNYLSKLKKDDKSKFCNKLYLSLMSTNKNKFWTSWKNKV